MKTQDYIALFNKMYPNFFASEGIRSTPEEYVFAEMALPLDDFDPHQYDKVLPESITFGYYQGDLAALREAVAQVDEGWPVYFDGREPVYCGFIDGQLASFCMVSDFGTHTVNGCTVKVGGPGCVGTLPRYRDRGVGLTMVKHVTQILKDEGFDLSFIHYTYVADWYAKLGYKTVLNWNCNGFVTAEEET